MNNDKIIWDDTKITALNYVRQRNLSPEGVTKKKTKKKKTTKQNILKLGLSFKLHMYLTAVRHLVTTDKMCLLKCLNFWYLKKTG